MLFTLSSAVGTLILFITSSIKQLYSNSLALTNNTAINFLTLNNTGKKGNIVSGSYGITIDI